MKPLSEFELIERIRPFGARPGGALVLSIGDDCAAWRPEPGELEVATTDTLVEGVHFSLRDAGPGEIGWKALAANISDITAMGARAVYALVSLSGPPELWAGENTIEIYRGMKPLADRYGVKLVGGNLTRSPERLSVQITLIGTVKEKSLLRRSGARPGDGVFVTGVPGRAAMWLELKKRKAGSKSLRELFRLVHYHPEPPVAFAQALSGQNGGRKLASTAIDISDGLLADLHHVLDASGGLGAKVDTGLLPDSVAHLLFQEATGAGKESLRRFGLEGGEDYELLFTAPLSRERLIQALGFAHGVRVTRIGEVTRSKGIRIVDGKGHEHSYKGQGGWRHF